MNARVAVVGLWHQGLVGAACLADWGYDVVAADEDAAKVRKLNDGHAPLFEPGLDELIQGGRRSGRLAFTADLAGAVGERPFVLLAHDTPVDENDRADLAPVFRAVDAIAPALAEGVSIHVTAQVPVGTCDEIVARIRAARPGLRFAVAYSPENLRLGQAIERFRKPPLPILGSDDDGIFPLLEKLYAPCGVAWQRCSLRTAEMSKHALNAFLAVSVTFANELGNLCDEVGADGHRLAELLRMEPRVGPKAMLFPGLGFSGGTLARDLQTLRALGDRCGIETPQLDGTWDSNRQQNRLVVRRLKAELDPLAGRRIAVLGLTYKPDTSTLRRSAALEVIAELAGERCAVAAHDPRADPTELRACGGFVLADSPIEAACGADAVVLMTPWPEYRSLDFAALKSAMRGTVVFDTANLWKAGAVTAAGLTYLDIGRGRGAGRRTCV
jgi:UDPglucose 6-dehydrogenase